MIKKDLVKQRFLQKYVVLLLLTFFTFLHSEYFSFRKFYTKLLHLVAHSHLYSRKKNTFVVIRGETQHKRDERKFLRGFLLGKFFFVSNFTWVVVKNPKINFQLLSIILVCTFTLKLAPQLSRKISHFLRGFNTRNSFLFSRIFSSEQSCDFYDLQAQRQLNIELDGMLHRCAFNTR